jgi:hypothetical protein
VLLLKVTHRVRVVILSLYSNHAGDCASEAAHNDDDDDDDNMCYLVHSGCAPLCEHMSIDPVN